MREALKISRTAFWKIAKKYDVNFNKFLIKKEQVVVPKKPKAVTIFDLPGDDHKTTTISKFKDQMLQSVLNSSPPDTDNPSAALSRVILDGEDLGFNGLLKHKGA